ncbi:hypothetical protein B0T18DRAFT_313218 [Schizothecium vesticola]|uniref:Uncharacterized protein n=1 Tax=Schizothecium vesticola TaxID=314040 RepID=A0AA40KBJ6_9PEZI|nr:hypothetical protein B0T18DRAFT_313218 [Schizothecium vesticola]
MERDVRRDRGQWRGCYSFRDIICDGDHGSVPKRNGGLKMGHTYYYYYELDGASETHDPAVPSTNTCPYLPGQTVNTLWVPVEQSNRQRSASLTSLRDDDFMTMNPADKFTTPRPAPTPPDSLVMRRIGTAPQRLQHKRSARSLSPAPAWLFSPRKLFSRTRSSSSLTNLTETCDAASVDDGRSLRSSDGSRSRDISPESLRRFLSEEPTPADEEPEQHDWPSLTIPEDIVEENEDDDNFASSAISETLGFTGLSPPPTQRSFTPSPPSTSIPPHPTHPPPQIPSQLPALASRLSFSDASFYADGDSTSSDLPSFYHSEDEEDDVVEEEEPLATSTTTMSLRCSFVRDLDAALSTYSLPVTAEEDDGKVFGLVEQRREEEVAPPPPSLLTSEIPSSGLEDLVSELGWMAAMIDGRA